jgi:hypothetical protein
VVFETFSETGFGRARFLGSGVKAADARLSEVLPLLVRLTDKAELTVDRIPPATLQRIAEIAAGGEVRMDWEQRGTGLGTVSLAGRKLSLSAKRPCGLRDLLFFAALLRVYAGMPEAGSVPLRQLFAATWEYIMEELPQALQYCSTASAAEATYGYAPEGLVDLPAEDAPPRGRRGSSRG